MRANSTTLYCAQCAACTLHERRPNYVQGGYAEACVRCGAVNTSHEAPAADAPLLASVGFSRLEIARLFFMRHLIERGIVGEPKATLHAW